MDAYDRRTNEYYVLFHPRSTYSWPTVLKKVGHYLVIGTRGEGLAIVNLDTFRLKHIVLECNDVYEIDIVNSKIKVNSSEELELPSF